MKIRLLIAFLLVVILGTPGTSIAQTTENQQWFSVDLSQNVGEYRWSVEQNLRTRYGFSIIDNSFTSLGLRRKINKYLTLSMNYRIGWKNPTFSPAGYHRFNFDARLSKKWKKQDFELKFRPRIQARFKPDEGRVKEKWYLRYKLTLSKKINKTFDVWVAGELFTRLNEKIQGLNNDEWRAVLGLDIDMGKRKELSVFYMYSNEFNQNDPSHNHIIGLGYSYKLKKWKKGKKDKK